MKTTMSLPRNRLRKAARTKRASSAAKVLKIANILVPTDFSPFSFQALNLALPLVKAFGAELHLAHVVPPDYPLSSLADLPMVVPELKIGRRVRTHLTDAVRKYAVDLRPGNIHALKGSPFEQICQLAKNAKIDMIIMSTHGHTGLKHLMLGSTAERVVRYAPCPVLVVRPSQSESGNGKFPRRVSFQKILVPVDFSDCSLRGLEYAKAFAGRFQSKLTLLHSVALQYYVTSDAYDRYDFAMVLEETEKIAREDLRKLLRKNDWNALDVETSLQVGHAGQQICAQAEELGADLIITSTHGRTGFKHVLLGSTAEYVMRHATIPVLVVPTRDRPPLSREVTKT